MTQVVVSLQDFLRIGEFGPFNLDISRDDLWCHLGEPTPDGYQSVTRLAGTDTISPLAAPEAAWTVATLLSSPADATETTNA